MRIEKLPRNVCVVEWLAMLAYDQGILGSDLTGGAIQLIMTQVQM